MALTNDDIETIRRIVREELSRRVERRQPGDAGWQTMEGETIRQLQEQWKGFGQGHDPSDPMPGAHMLNGIPGQRS